MRGLFQVDEGSASSSVDYGHAIPESAERRGPLRFEVLCKDNTGDPDVKGEQKKYYFGLGLLAFQQVRASACRGAALLEIYFRHAPV